MKILLDMNLSPMWVRVLERHGWEAVHWLEVGDPRATDRAVMDWAREHGYVVITHDLDFGAMLAATRAEGPSVIQVRTQDVLPAHLEAVLVGILKEHEAVIEAGALVVVEEDRARVRVLPLSR
jgi:predicted nuclease of predicted toxin-antitoxin system